MAVHMTKIKTCVWEDLFVECSCSVEGRDENEKNGWHQRAFILTVLLTQIEILKAPLSVYIFKVNNATSF